MVARVLERPAGLRRAIEASALRRRRQLGALIGAALVFAVARPAAAIPPDEDFETRRVETLQGVAERFEERDTYTDCVELGFSSAAMMAKLRLGEMGEPEGRSVADAADDLETLADSAIQQVGSAGDPCTWEEAGSPGVMHAALAFGYILNQWGDDLPDSTRQELIGALEGHWRDEIGPYLVNGNISIVAGRLLGGEALGYDSALWERGAEELAAIYERTLEQGGLEMNAPLYGAYHYAALLPLMDLADDELRSKARILLEYQLAVQAHLYLPGGALGRPQARDRNFGGALDNPQSSLHRVIGYLTGEELYEPTSNIHLVGAVSDYQLPEVLRSIFLDKGSGYEFWAYTDAPVGGRFPRSSYEAFTETAPVAPWQAIVAPGGDAMFAINHGYRFNAIHASMGVYARGSGGELPILYHYQPFVEGDTTDTGSGIPSSNDDLEPDDFVRELYDYERFARGQSLIALWDPTLELKEEEVVRTHQDTRAHIPDYDAYGGELLVDDESRWFAAQMSDTYIGYRPLGTFDVEPERRSSIPGPRGEGSRETEHYYLRLDGRSGAIVELAGATEFDSLEDYVSDLRARHVAFEPEGEMHAEFDARDPDTGETSRMRLEYAPERRFVDGEEVALEDALDHGLLDSPWARVSEEGDARTLTLSRGCHESVVYDLDAASMTAAEPDPEACDRFPEAGPIFSDIEYFGDARNYDDKTEERWSVVEADGDSRLYLEPFEFEADGDRLGEYALVADRQYDAFTMRFDARTALDPGEVDHLDWAVVFGYQDPDHYYFMLANDTPEHSELFVVEEGERTRLAGADEDLVSADAWAEMELLRDGDGIEVWHEGERLLAVEDDTYGEGRVGVGTLNDAVLFDDIDVTALEEPAADEPVGLCQCAAGNRIPTAPLAVLVVALALVLRRRAGGCGREAPSARGGAA